MAIYKTPGNYFFKHFHTMIVALKLTGDPIRHELTSRNYIKVLTQILS
jgi:hypothetical protein